MLRLDEGLLKFVVLLSFLVEDFVFEDCDGIYVILGDFIFLKFIFFL